jgi:hypothetical protein
MAPINESTPPIATRATPRMREPTEAIRFVRVRLRL